MKKLFILVAALSLSSYLNAQPKSTNSITAEDLQSHVSFLASPLMEGRLNGDEKLDIAANYIATQAKLAGLKPANAGSYFQPVPVLQTEADPAKTFIQVIHENSDTVRINERFFHIIPQGPADLDLAGDVVFAGYGIKSESYNDLENLDIKGKIVIVMDNGPLNADGKPSLSKLFYGGMGFQYKLGALLSPGPKAILFVPDPASGYSSFYDSPSGLANYLSTVTIMEGEKEQRNAMMAMMPKVLFVSTIVADELLKGTGRNLAEMQKQISSTLSPQSSAISGKRIAITERIVKTRKILNNVAAYVEGSDSEKKKEVVIFSAHYDHVGASGTKIYAGADDNASGCAALLEMGEAFSSLKKKPLRTILFLWVAGEEIGLFGSKAYVENPLFPLKETIANLNMDMIGRTKEAADSTSDTPMTGPNGVFVITGGQSRELTDIANEADKRSVIDFDYSLSGRNHPLQLFARSDHYNFVRKDIPVLFFTTGLHSDYHTSGDIIEKLNFGKMEKITRTMYDIGFTVANRKERLVVDNPFSSWK